MLYGHLETPEERVDHLLALRAAQDETGGFLTFIPLAFHPKNTDLAHLADTTGFDDLKNLAAARLLLDNFPHIKAFWVWPGGGITYMVDVTTMPDKSFGYVPTPALVAPIEFTLRLDDYRALGGHAGHIRPLDSLRAVESVKIEPWRPDSPWPLDPLAGVAK